jgi:hypothetical protein
MISRTYAGEIYNPLKNVQVGMISIGEFCRFGSPLSLKFPSQRREGGVIGLVNVLLHQNKV